MTELERFDQKWVPEPNSGCWLWVGSLHRAGYGKVQFEKVQILAHRRSWMLRRGQIPAGLVICHKCDTPTCVNPAHLFIGTHSDNQADKIAKGRQCRGESVGVARLTEVQVAEIRFSVLCGERQARIASRFGICPSHVSKIASGHRWHHSVGGT